MNPHHDHCVQELDPPFGRPHWQHDCDRCQYLGTMSLEDRLGDFYRCPAGVLGLTFLCRWDHEPPNYSSLPEMALAYMAMPEGDRITKLLWLCADFYRIEPRDEKLGVAVLFRGDGHNTLLVRAHPLLSPHQMNIVARGVEVLRRYEGLPATRRVLYAAHSQLCSYMAGEIKKGL